MTVQVDYAEPKVAVSFRPHNDILRNPDRACPNCKGKMVSDKLVVKVNGHGSATSASSSLEVTVATLRQKNRDRSEK